MYVKRGYIDVCKKVVYRCVWGVWVYGQYDVK